MLELHEDAAMFREAVRFTQVQTGLAARLIEKDYFCTVLLDYLATADPTLVFKGGTCLAKVHAGFYRMSEDLDYVIPVATDGSRSERSRLVTGFREAMHALPRQVPGFQVVQPVRGANNSTQYHAVLEYQSRLTVRAETIQVEMALREPLLTLCVQGSARTLLLDPISGQPLVEPVKVQCLSLLEAFAEKWRAALSRRDPAIRDFYDLDHAIRHLGLSPADAELRELIRRKLAMPGNPPIDVTDARRAALQLQLDPQLRAVLREQDFGRFDLGAVFRIVVDMATRLE